MSHYSVMAIRKPNNDTSIEESMEFYNEELEVAPYVDKSYLEIVEEGRELLDSTLDKECIEIIVDGGTKKEWRDKIIETYPSLAHSDKEQIENMWKFDKKRADLFVESKKREITDDEYHDLAVEYNSYECNKHGDSLCSYNPNSKWDWYVEGGRWSGQLILKKEAAERYGTDRVNSALYKEIDWAKMNSLTDAERDHYIDIWKYHVMEEPFPGTDEEKKERLGWFLYRKEWYLERYKTLDNFLDSMARWTTHAVLDDEGEWHEAGEMGWFGVSSAETDDEIAWEKGFSKNFIEGLPADTRITILDCHI